MMLQIMIAIDDNNLWDRLIDIKWHEILNFANYESLLVSFSSASLLASSSLIMISIVSVERSIFLAYSPLAARISSMFLQSWKIIFFIRVKVLAGKFSGYTVV